MKIIIVIIALILERYVGIGERLARFAWFNQYLDSLKRLVSFPTLWQGYQGVVMIIFPILVIIWMLNWIMAGWLFGLVGIVFSLFILIYCLGPIDLFTHLSQYLSACGGDEQEQATPLAKDLLGGTVPTDEHDRARAITRMTLYQANERTFAVVFWFIVLGPLGAILYRLVSLVLNAASRKHSSILTLAMAASKIHQIVDWIPARLLGLCYALMGHFTASFAHWFKYAWGGLETSKDFIMDCGSIALDLGKGSSKATCEENQAALALVDRGLIIFLVMVAVFTIGGWIA